MKRVLITAPLDVGPEFGDEAGRTAIIVRSLYGLKSAGASFRNHLADWLYATSRMVLVSRRPGSDKFQGNSL